MKQRIILFLILIFISPLLVLAQNNEGNISKMNTLVWSDEFDEDGALDSEKWFHQTIIPNGNSWFNGEIQHYTDRIENTYVEDGIMHLVAKKESYSDQGVLKQYTSARLNTKFAFTYGRVEIRAKLPTGLGTWPALWMLGKNITEKGAYWETQGFGTTGWPACGEIDIMEHWGDNQDYVSSAMHTPSSFGNTFNKGGTILPNASSEFHVFEMEWTEESITFSIDGDVHYTYNPPVKNDDTWPFDKDQYILFNVAMLPSVQSSFVQSTMEVDYIRIYQEGGTSSVEDLEENAHLIYPNPVDSAFHIDLGEILNEDVHIEIYNANGSLISTTQQSINGQLIKVESLKNSPSGTYFIQLKKGKESYRYKVVKR